METAPAAASPPGAARLVLRVEAAPAAADIAALDDSVATFTMATSGDDPPRELAVFVRQDGRVVAGVRGWTWGQCCELVSLWVDAPLRGRGLGGSLLAAAEDEAAARGCRQVVLFTHTEQAPGFYARAGYELVGHVDEYPVGSAAHWFRKRLDDGAADVEGARLLEAGAQLVLTAVVVAEIVQQLQRWSRRQLRRVDRVLSHLAVEWTPVGPARPRRHSASATPGGGRRLPGT